MKNICDWNNCLEEGSYKAPVEKDNSKKYRMLCLTKNALSYYASRNNSRFLKYTRKPFHSFISSYIIFTLGQSTDARRVI